MNYLMGFLTVLVVISCSSAQRDEAAYKDSGAQKQEAIYDETRNEQEEKIRNQFPGGYP